MLQAAIAHAQFETIHPFADGNGRSGRALIYAVLRRRAEAVNNALRHLEQTGVVRRLNERKWGRAWECTELLELVEGFEENVAAGVAA